MTQFTHRRVNQVAGVFVLLVLLIEAAGIYMAGRAQRWFEARATIHLLLPEEGSFGLKPGAVVMVMGTDVGDVEDIQVRADGRMTARANVRRDFARFIGADSRAIIKKTFGMAGDSFVEIIGGPGQPLRAGALMETLADRAPTETFQEVLDQIRTEVLPAVRGIRLAAEEYTQLAVNLKKLDRPARQALNTVNSIATKIDRGDGLASRALSDKQMADQVGGMVNRINTTLDQVGAAAKELGAVAVQTGKSAGTLHEVIEQLPETIRQVNATLKDVRKITDNMVRVTAAMPTTLENVNQQLTSLAAMIVQTQTALREIERLVKGMQRHWLIRGYMDAEKPNGRIAPQNVILTRP